MKFPLLASALVLALASTARAEETEGPKSTDDPPQVPFETDLVGGHLQMGVNAGYAFPFGRLSDEASHLDRAGRGGVFGVDVNYGLDRFVFVGVYGQYGLFGDSSNCDGCSATEWGVGLQTTYHVVQGLKIDPWISYGVGFRQLSTKSDADSYSYGALEWMRLSVGTNWFATSTFFVSPYATFSAASTVVASDDETAGRVDMRFLFGIRLGLDLPGR